MSQLTLQTLIILKGACRKKLETQISFLDLRGCTLATVNGWNGNWIKLLI